MYAKINELQTRCENIKDTLDGYVLEISQYSYGSIAFDQTARNISLWSGFYIKAFNELKKLREEQAKAMHTRYIGVIIELSDLAKEINAKANKR